MKRKIDAIDAKGIGNTKQSPPAKHYCFTLNNFKTEDLDVLKKKMENDSYVIGKEVGEEGTPHLQGYVRFKHQTRWTALKKIDERIHWEKCRNIEASKKYCMKDNDFVTNIKMPKPLKLWRPPYKWCDDVDKIIAGEPDYRKVYWFWEAKGGAGKSQYSKWLANNKDGVIVVQSCKSADILTVIDNDIEVLILDFPRGQHPGTYFPCNAIEQIKNGMIMDGKLKKKARMLCFNTPHVIVFANEPPGMIGEMSDDRIVVVEINLESPSASQRSPHSL